MDIERKFEDLGVDAITGTKLMSLLRLTPEDFLDPSRFLRFKDVIDHFKHMPDTEYVVNRLTIGKALDKLDHVWGYVELSRQKEGLSKRVELENNKARFTPPEDLASHAVIKESIDSLARDIYQVEQQIEMYEN